MDTPPSRIAIGVLLFGGFIVLAYLPSFSVPFVFDDAPNIVFNPNVQPEQASELRNALDARGERDRPVAMLTFALNYLHAGLDARWYHAVNLAIHLINSGLLFALLLMLARAPLSPRPLNENAVRFALAAALIWALHPVNTQAVTYIVQRMASLAATFYLLGLIVFVLWRSGRIGAAWAGAGFAAAFLAGFGTKANVVTMPLAALLIEAGFFRGLRRNHGIALGVIVLAGITLAILYAGKELSYILEAPPHRDFSGLERLLTQARVVCHYLSLLVWPDADRLQLDYDFSISRSLLDPPTTLAATIFLGAITLLAVAGFHRARWPAVGWLFFLLALSVESSIILLELAFEHRVYLPATLLIAGVLAPLFTRFTTNQGVRYLSLALIVLAGVLAWQTMERNRQWQDLGRFWVADLERGASPYRAALNGGIAYLRAGNADRAMELFDLIEQRALATNDRQRAKIAQLKGETHFSAGQFDAALEEFRRAIEMQPNWTRAAYFAALALLQLGHVDAAANMHEQLRMYDGDSVFTVSLNAQMLYSMESPQAGIDHLLQYIETTSGVSAVNRSFLHLQLGNMYRDQGEWSAAMRHYELSRHNSRDNWAASAALSEMNARTVTEQEIDLGR